MIYLEADLRPIADVMAINGTIVDMMESFRFREAISDWAAEVSATSFVELMDEKAEANPAAFGHMYEWGELGQASGRLWKMIIAGSGGSRFLTFDYKQSTEEVPAGEEATGIEGDTRTMQHIFVWKAPVVENGVRVRINPLFEDGWLAIPVGEGSGPNTSKSGSMWFTKRTVSPHPNQQAEGAFTEAWIQHFSTVAVKVAEEYVYDEVEEYLEDVEEELYSQIPESRVTSMPRISKAFIDPESGRRIGHRANGHFMNRAEKEAQILRLQRMGYNFE